MRRRLTPSALVLLVAACAPATPIRRSALVPAAAPPARLGVPLAAGQTQVTGDIGPVRDPAPITPLSVVLSFNFSPQVGDPGLLIPTITIGASLYHGVSRWVELGAHIRYAHYTWSEPTATGVLPIPRNEDAFVLYGGPGFRLNVPIADAPVTFSSLVELNLAHMSEAHFFCASCTGERTALDPEYRFDGMTSTTWILPKAAMLLDVRAVETLHLYGGVAAESGFHNVGFDNDASTRGQSSIEQHLVGMPLVGLAADLAGLTLGATFSFPLSDEKTGDGPGFSMSMGYRWGEEPPKPVR